jgi:ATP-dependent Clp protease protease subunit
MGKSATLKVYGDIGSDVTDVMVADFLDANQEAEDITVKINSFGGDVQTGWNIYDLLKTSGKKITTVGEGKVYSIATVIFLAGSEREMLPNSDGIIQMPRISNPEGTFQADDFRKLTTMMDQEEEKILNLYAQVTGKDIDLLKDYMKKETTLSAEDMVTMGFATKITEQYKAVAYFNLKSNKPIMNEKEVKTFGEKLDLLIAKVSGFSRISPKNQTFTDKEGKELTIEKESGAPAVGDKATPDGTFVMTDGKTITVVDGAITEVTEPAVDNAELDAANAKIAELQAKLDEAEAVKAEAEAAKVQASEKEAQATALIAELSALKNSWKPASRSQVNSTNKVGSVDLNRVSELREKTKSKTE